MLVVSAPIHQIALITISGRRARLEGSSQTVEDGDLDDVTNRF